MAQWSVQVPSDTASFHRDQYYSGTAATQIPNLPVIHMPHPPDTPHLSDQGQYYLRRETTNLIKYTYIQTEQGIFSDLQYLTQTGVAGCYSNAVPVYRYTVCTLNHKVHNVHA